VDGPVRFGRRFGHGRVSEFGQGISIRPPPLGSGTGRQPAVLSGQVGIDPTTKNIVPGGIADETQQTMTNIKTTLETHGYAMSDLVKCTVMLADISEWSAFNEVYKTFFAAHYPARSTLSASGLAFGARVEVDCIAARGD
jgi:reactive intermediate/imine deaminase